jgi:hypothetical protein
MIAFNPNSLCANAEPYYYDFLLSKGEESVPEEIVRHIGECRSCRDKLSQLQAALSQADNVDAEERQADSAIATMLRLHFAYIGKPVTCRVVKPFLPTLLDPVLEVRVPTPITVHLNNCPQCSEDLQTIQAMGLSRKQLGRLSRLFAENPLEDAVKCSEVHLSRMAAALLALNKATAEALKHICVCPDCRKALYQHRQSVREDFLRCGEVQESFPCEQVSAADIFDYCVPYGIDPAADQYAEFRGSLASHLCSCPTCLGKMQELHNAVYEIVERPDSEVITTCRIDESVRVQTPTDPDGLYAGFPIRAETTNSKSQAKPRQPALSLGAAIALKKKVFAVNVKPLAKIAAVAAGILILATLLLNTPTAKAVTIERIYKAIGKVKNVHITSLVPGEEKPIQEQWVSRDFKVRLIRTKEESVLWDIPNGTMTVKRLDGGPIEAKPLSPEMIAQTKEMITGSLGLVPFADLSIVPKGADWSRVSGDDLEVAAEGMEISQLSWVEKAYGGSDISWKWRVFVDTKTDLPQKTESYRKLARDVEYTLVSVKVIAYLGRDQMQAVIKGASF